MAVFFKVWVDMLSYYKLIGQTRPSTVNEEENANLTANKSHWGNKHV